MRRAIVLLAVLSAAALFAGSSQAGFPAGQCTAWAFLMRPDIVVDSMLANRSLTNWNADHWAVNAQAAGLSVGTRAAAGAIAVWPARVDGSGAVGHVAYVQQVKAGAFYVTEEDFNGNPSPTGRWLTHAASSVRFIYLQAGMRAPTGPIADGGALSYLTTNGTYTAAAPATTTVQLGLSAPTVAGLRLTGPGIDRTVTWSLATAQVLSLAQITGGKPLVPGTYTLVVIPYSTSLSWRSITLRLA